MTVLIVVVVAKMTVLVVVIVVMMVLLVVVVTVVLAVSLVVGLSSQVEADCQYSNEKKKTKMKCCKVWLKSTGPRKRTKK